MVIAFFGTPQFAVPSLERLIYPYVVALQTVPKVAIAPLIVVPIGQRLKAGRGAGIGNGTMDERDEVRGQRHLVPSRHGRRVSQNRRALDCIYCNVSP